MVNKDLGMVTAYAYAVSKGYTGTEEEFAALMADYAAVGQRAEQAATSAAASATAASGSASDSAASATAAEGSATAAATSAGNASQAAQSASQSATAAAGSATAAGQSATAAAGSATTAGNKATEAAQSATGAAASATTAGTAATNAQAAQTAAETAQTAAEDAQAAAEAAAQTLVIDPTLTQPNQAAEAKATGDAIDAVNVQLGAALIVNEASGAIATFADGSEGVPVRSLTVGIEPIQSGTGDPSPENVRPISGRTEVTVYRTGDRNNEGWTRNSSVDENGNIITGSGTEYYCSPYIKATTIVYIDIQARASGSRYFTIGAYNANKGFISMVRRGTISSNAHRVESYNLPEGTAYICMSFGKGPNGTINYVVGDYDPRYTVQLGDTVYGGSLDVTNGVLTVTKANIASYNGEELPGAWISDRDVYSPDAVPTTGAQVVYDLAEPQTYQLTPTEVTTLLGQNNIWADSGDVDVSYVADTKLYISQLTEPDADMVADANITSGQYFMVGNSLFLATANIANGSAIVPGTNCTRTNLADALNAINA